MVNLFKMHRKIINILEASKLLAVLGIISLIDKKSQILFNSLLIFSPCFCFVFTGLTTGSSGGQTQPRYTHSTHVVMAENKYVLLTLHVPMHSRYLPSLVKLMATVCGSPVSQKCKPPMANRGVKHLFQKSQYSGIF